eukprot:3304916-Rhodomonas_salina.2
MQHAGAGGIGHNKTHKHAAHRRKLKKRHSATHSTTHKTLTACTTRTDSTAQRAPRPITATRLAPGLPEQTDAHLRSDGCGSVLVAGGVSHSLILAVHRIMIRTQNNQRASNPNVSTPVPKSEAFKCCNNKLCSWCCLA